MKIQQKIGAVLLRALFWALSGTLFGGLFTGLYQVFSLYGNPEWMTLTLATGLAAAVTAAFFGAMPVALMGSMIGVLVAIGYQMFGVGNVRPLFMFGVALGLGGLAGSFYSGQIALRLRPLGQTVSGALAGALAGPVLFALIGAFAVVAEPLWRAMAAVSLVGILFIIVSRWILAMCSEWISQRMSGPVVAGLVALAVAASMWLLGSNITGGGPPSAMGVSGEAARLIGLGALGGACGGAMGGAMLELLGLQRSTDYL